MATSALSYQTADVATAAPLTTARSHAVPLPGGAWTMWRTVAVRAAGFPAALVLGLAAPRAARAADEYIQAEAEVEIRRQAAIERLRAEPDESPDVVRRLRARRRAVKKDTIGPDATTPEELALASALHTRDAAQAALRAAYELDCAAQDAQILRTLDHPRFREAAIWQNAAAFRVACAQLRKDSSDTQARRRATELVAMLLQRYTVKNDSIGFFGPVGWATIVDRPCVIDVSAPPELLATRTVYFEAWAIDAVASRIAADPRTRIWTAPRVKAGVWLRAEGVDVPGTGRVELTPLERQALALCDGTATAHEIAAALVGDSGAAARSPQDVYDALQRLVAAGVIAWQFEVAQHLYPERELEARVARFGDADLRHEHQHAVSRLLEGRRRVADAAGDADALATAIDDLNDTFESITGQPSTRCHGQTYGARTIVYEDCRRAAHIAVGSGLIDRLGPPLTLMLDAMQWVLVQFAAEARRRLCECHAAEGAAEVDAQTFFEHASRATERTWRAPAERIVRNFQTRWVSILGLQGDERHVRRACDEVVERAREAFPTIGPTWTRAAYASPDIMVSAASPDALRRGAFHAVLGELHCYNTILTSALFAQHPDPDCVLDAMAAECGAELPVLVQRLRIDELARTRMLGVHPTFWRFEWGDEPPSHPRCRPLVAGRFVATCNGTTVQMQARDGSFAFDALDLFAPILFYWINRLFADVLPAERHTPRVTIDDLTIARERWNIAPRDMPFLDVRDRVLQFASLRAWARAQGMPRHVFSLAPKERKPCYVDFDSPAYVDAFVRLMKRAPRDTTVRLVEMLPGIDEAWLTDANGMRYTSELRFVARLGARPRAGTNPPHQTVR